MWAKHDIWSPSIKTISREVLLKGKAHHSWPPCTNLFRWAPLYIQNIILLFYKTATLMRRSTVLSLPTVSFPCHKCFFYSFSKSALLGSTKANGRELKSCLGRVFNFRLGCFVMYATAWHIQAPPSLELITRPRFVSTT